MKRGIAQLITGITITLSVVFFAIPALASNTDGTINASSKYAWSSKAGWINFGATNGNIHITDSAITGSAWSDLYGWIKMNPTKSGVLNNSEGVLSGYAWNANLGWINFVGVTIDSSGNFAGQATGDNFGALNFSCTHCAVNTDWRPASSRTECNNGIDDDADGKTDYPADTDCASAADNDESSDSNGAGYPPPSGGFTPAPSYFMILNNDSAYTDSLQANVTLRCGSALYAWLSENSDFSASDMKKIDCDAAGAYTYSTFNLSAGEGLKTVYAKFCNQWGHCSDPRSDSIIYSLAPPAAPEYPTTTPAVEKERPPSVVAGIKEYLKSLLTEIIPPIKISELPVVKIAKEKWLPRLIKLIPRFAKQPALPPLEKVVTKKAPLAMSGKLPGLIDSKPLGRFVLAPLPKEFLALAEKMPQVKTTFEKVGVKRMSDLKKLASITMKLPSLSQIVGLKTTTTLALAGLKQFKTTPLAELPKDLKKKIPTDIIFTRGANELVDMNVALTLSETGKAEQKIRTISGKPLELSIKPEYPVKSVRGYVIFKSRTKESSSVMMPLVSWFNSLIFSDPVLAYPLEANVVPTSPLALPKPQGGEGGVELELETKLVLQEFTYSDSDKDGIYTATIMAPVPEGEYEILTVMDYEDPDLGTKQVRLITVVDPEGYVYESIRDQELRVRGAVVSLYWLNKEQKRYELWPAADYQQENPQITDSRGTYSFLVPEGTYYLAVEAPGYLTWEGKTFRVTEGEGVHYNIEMKTKNWWMNIVDWRTALLVVIGLFLVYNFYRDRKNRKRIPNT